MNKDDFWEGYVPEPVKPAQQEPVATLWQHGETGRTRITMPGDITDCDARWFKAADLYTSPPAQRKPLTDDQIRGLTPKPDGIAESDARRVEVLPGVMGTEYDEVDAWSMPLVMQIARAIEAAHGIKENT